MTVGTLALSDRLAVDTEPLPEVEHLRRRSDESDPQGETEEPDWAQPETAEREIAPPVRVAPAVPERAPSRTANVELVIDTTSDVTVRAMRRYRERVAGDEPDFEAAERADAQPTDVEPAAAESPTAIAARGLDRTQTTALAVGAELSGARERIGLSVDDLAARTRIRPPVIEAIEGGDFGPCGGDFYARGHLRMLAGVLGLDPQPLLARYDADIAQAPVSPRAVFDAELASSVVRPTGRGSRWGALIAAVLVLLLAWGVARYVVGDLSAGSAPRPGSSVGLDRSGGGPQHEPLLPGGQVTATITATGAVAQVEVWNAARTVVYSGNVHPHHAQVVRANGPLRIEASPASAVSVSVPGQSSRPVGTTHASAAIAVH